MLLDSSESNYQVFNIGRGKPGSILEVAKALIEIFGKSLTPDIIGKFRNGDIRHCYADTSKISALGFEPELSLKEGLTDLVAWGDQQTAVSRIEDAHQELVARGLIV